METSSGTDGDIVGVCVSMGVLFRGTTASDSNGAIAPVAPRSTMHRLVSGLRTFPGGQIFMHRLRAGLYSCPSGHRFAIECWSVDGRICVYTTEDLRALSE